MKYKNRRFPKTMLFPEIFSKSAKVTKLLWTFGLSSKRKRSPDRKLNRSTARALHMRGSEGPTHPGTDAGVLPPKESFRGD